MEIDLKLKYQGVAGIIFKNNVFKKFKLFIPFLTPKKYFYLPPQKLLTSPMMIIM